MAKTKTTTTEQQLTVKKREAMGSRSVRRLRREGLVPGVVYGRGVEPLSVAVEQRQLRQVLHSKTGEHSLVTLRMGGTDSWQRPALVQAVQHDPLDGHILHVDFHAIRLTERLRVKVPVVLNGEPVGVKQDGGILEQFLREVEVECLPAEIPAAVECDISALKIGETVHVRDLASPTHARIVSDAAGVIASVQQPKAEKPEEAEAAAPAEPEVIREKKEEPAAAAEEAKGEKAPEAKKEKDVPPKTH